MESFYIIYLKANRVEMMIHEELYATFDGALQDANLMLDELYDDIRQANENPDCSTTCIKSDVDTADSEGPAGVCIGHVRLANPQSTGCKVVDFPAVYVKQMLLPPDELREARVQDGSS